jgi:hypothetical protein
MGASQFLYSEEQSQQSTLTKSYLEAVPRVGRVEEPAAADCVIPSSPFPTLLPPASSFDADDAIPCPPLRLLPRRRRRRRRPPEHVNLWLSPDALTPALWIKAPNKRIPQETRYQKSPPKKQKTGHVMRKWVLYCGPVFILFCYFILFYFILWGQFCAVRKVMIIDRKI